MSADKAFWLVIYLALVTGLVYLAYLRFNRRWRRRERARTVVGVLVVLGPALVGGVSGLVDLLSVLVVVAGFCVAGLTTLGLDIEQETTESEIIREALGE